MTWLYFRMTSAQIGTKPGKITRNSDSRVSHYFRTKGHPLMPFDRMLTSSEAADILRVGPWQVVKLCKSGELPATKPSRAWLIAESDLRAYLDKHSNQSEADQKAAS